MDNLVSMHTEQKGRMRRTFVCHKRERAITCMLFGDLHFKFLCFGLLQKEV